MNKITAVIVTYNRIELLMECLDAVLGQSYPVSHILLIDNASSDGTPEILKEKGYLDHPEMEYHRMKKNLGGAGGFYEGIRRAPKESGSWIWVMDDDTIPSSTCLEELIHAQEFLGRMREKASFLASAVYGAQGEFMNVPKLDQSPSPNGYEDWYKYLSDGIVKISQATFVSIMINSNAVKNCGLPCKDYFIWGDDYEYTKRLSTYYSKAYFVGKSVAIHKRANAKALNISNEDDPNRIAMFHYYFRNNAIIRRFYRQTPHPLRRTFMDMFRTLKYLKESNGTAKMKAAMKGHIESIVQYKYFARYINSQLGK